ncbi:small GTP-binding protein, putative [Trichomonas vaginalis G3]|uniref:Small GTP-binding protein, putative n=1 Tax=Trichomonas vaginalis (strain ATCC PRA-98 / G3) TaxID=412133 RepID=A2EBY3_TRIV3|nr:GTPase protein [Trichomonas vaginalis G3]EAY09851.1 small GTP-binding protein, putative [Trichomonas vaginalis G3]KAI5505920.1 GTPase protein [Trichomonas vaginalis G3]|eukprot:XP_001322074.1 small GTP-binding protein [Trichomonas vaginalis G3]
MTSLDLKIVVLGPAGVGKTCVINRYCNDTYLENTLSTIGAGFFPQTVNINDVEVNMMIWDTAGEERFKSIAPSLLRGANGLVLIYDVTSPDSFTDVDIYLNMFLDTVDYDQSKPLPVMLLGNKGDMSPVVSDQTVNEWLSKNNIPLHKVVSAKTGDGISEAFTEFVKTFLTRSLDQEKRMNFIQITPPDNTKKSSNCC